MSTKNEVLSLLMKSGGNYLSGQEMAESIFVTRASVWKAIKQLEKDGYEIEAVTNRGYRLKQSFDCIDTELIKSIINDGASDIKIFHYEEVTSTNDVAREINEQGEKSDFLVIADKQTNGRGRRGRAFYSPKNSGLYMSFVLHPGGDFGKLSSITGTAATATAKAIDEVFFGGKDVTKIKWVNDIFINERKVSGILTEGFTILEDPDQNYIVIGFGVNIYESDDGFPKEIKKIAGVITRQKNVDAISGDSLRSRLAAEIIRKLRMYHKNKTESLRIYREKSNLIGSYVLVKQYNNESGPNVYAKVTGINNKYHLIIEYENGAIDELSSGEVSVVKY